MKTIVRWLICIFILLGLAACGLPNEIEQRAETVRVSIEGLGESLKQQQAEFNSLPEKDTALWNFVKPYSEKEKWLNKFTDADANIAQLKSRFESQVQPILKEDNEEKVAELTKLLDGIEGNFDAVKSEMKWVTNRISLLTLGQKNAEPWIKRTRTLVAELKKADGEIAPVSSRAREQFPERMNDINLRYVPLAKLVTTAGETLVLAEREYAKHVSQQDADYAIFADSVKTVETTRTDFATLEKEYRTDLDGLSQDYTVVLRDMKVEYRVQIGRTSWEESEWNEWPTEHQLLYGPVFIPKSTFDYLSALSEGEWSGQKGNLASYGSGWSTWSTEVHIDAQHWNVLGVKSDAQWPSGDNSSEFAIEELEPVYYHKYAKISGTSVAEGGWEEVDEEEYGQHVDSFGMAIETKPLGKFPDEAIDEPTPVGMAMVNDKRYGEWKTDSTGNSFWHYYGQYAFINALLGGNDHRYSRGEYGTYSSWRKERERDDKNPSGYGWYGSSRTSPTYGSSGSYTTKTMSYKASPFEKAGGVRAVSPSLRDAGVTARSRGPGGGGK
jgi:hypothetical protein